MFVRGDTVYAYSANDKVYAMSATGGQVLWQHQMGQPGDQIQPPLILDKGITVIPGVTSIDRIDAHGNVLPNLEIGHSIHSPASGSGNVIYCGLSYPTGGRLAKIDLTKNVNPMIWEFMVQGGVSAGTALFQGIIYAGGEDGKVYALNEQGQIVWPLANGGLFKTDGRIIADLKADATGVYVASTDTKLYCLEATTGKIKWIFYAATPLNDPPALTADSVYQPVPNQGVVALDKTTGDYARKPRWTIESAKRFLAEDAQYTYLQGVDNSIIGVDKKTGEQKFHSQRNDLVAFASNPKSNMIYAATVDGNVLGIAPVTKPGTVGQVVKIDLELIPVAIAK
jgi:outer membrane protein assembly factor BamB